MKNTNRTDSLGKELLIIGREKRESIRVEYDFDLLLKYSVTNSERNALLNISKFINKQTHIISDSKGVPINQTEVAKMVGITTKTVGMIMRNLIQKNIISKIYDHKTVYYLVNPYVIKISLANVSVLEFFDKNGNDDFLSLLNKKEDKVRIPLNSSEKFIERYISENPELIEAGLKIIKCQYSVPDGGFIDILAEDINGIKVIIEIKNNPNDKRIVFQCVFYRTQFDEEVRIMSICPSYSAPIKIALDALGFVEVKTYSIENGILCVS